MDIFVFPSINNDAELGENFTYLGAIHKLRTQDFALYLLDN